MIEADSGIGALGKGFEQCDFITACYNDFNPRFCQWLRQKTTVPGVEGDLTQPATIHAIHTHAPDAQFLSGGMSCQPFLLLGDRREEGDQRSSSFTGLLVLFCFLKVSMIFMECTKEVMQSKWAQDVIHQFCLQTGFHVKQALLDIMFGRRCAHVGGQFFSIPVWPSEVPHQFPG